MFLKDKSGRVVCPEVGGATVIFGSGAANFLLRISIRTLQTRFLHFSVLLYHIFVSILVRPVVSLLVV